MSRSRRIFFSSLRKCLLILATIALIGCAQTAINADPVTGTLNMFVSVNITASTLQPTTGVFVGGGSNGTFVAGTIGSMASATNTPGAQSVTNYLNINGVSFNLTSVQPGIYSSADCGAPAAANQLCTPTGSIFSLFNNLSNTSSNLSWTVLGNFVGTAGELTPYSGTFSASFSGQSFQQILPALNSGTLGPIAFSASFTPTGPPTTPTPEPTTLLLFATGLTGFVTQLRKRFR